MDVSVAGKAVLILIVFSLFSCGDMETLFPENTSYQVKTLVNGTSLEDCSIVRFNDKIRPYFAVSVVDDPDLISLLVYLQDSQGEIAGERIFYTLHSYASVPVITEPEESKAETIEETNGKNPWELPEQGTVKEKWTFTNTRYEKQDTDVEIAVYSLAEELPYFPLPKKLEIGSYTLVFEALGQKETLSRTETNIFYLGNVEFNLNDISMYLPGLSSGSQLIAPGITVMLEARLDFDNRLDPYVIWYNGKHIINRGKISDGAGSILWKTPEQTSFYSLRLEVFPFQLRSGFTGISREIVLPVSSKAVSMGYFFEKDLNHAGYASRSLLAEGTVYPQQVRLITAMLPAEDSDTEVAEGKNIPAMPSPPELLQWYQFEGGLRNVLSSNVLSSTDEQSLTPADGKPPRWSSAGQSYGLVAGSDDVYLLSPVNFFRTGQDQGGGIFLLHIRPPIEGTILNAFFPLQSSASDGVAMDLMKEKTSITLRLSAGGTTVEIPVYFASLESPDFIPIAVEFYIRPYRLEAKISLGEEYSLHQNTGKINLSGILSGKGAITLGDNLNKTSPMVQNTTAVPAGETLPKITTMIDTTAGDGFSAVVETLASSENNFPESAIWDELAILRSAIPLLQEEFHDTAANAETGKTGEGENVVLPLTSADEL